MELHIFKLGTGGCQKCRKILLINALIWEQCLSKTWNDMLFFWNCETLKSWILEVLQCGDLVFGTLKLWNLQTVKLWNFLVSTKGIPSHHSTFRLHSFANICKWKTRHRWIFGDLQRWKEWAWKRRASINDRQWFSMFCSTPASNSKRTCVIRAS